MRHAPIRLQSRPIHRKSRSVPISRSLRIILIVVWIAALALAFSFDRHIALWIRDSAPVNKNKPLTHIALVILKGPGYFPVTIAIAVLLAIFHRRHLQAALALLFSGVLGGTLYQILKWTVGRYRPVKGGFQPFAFHPFPKGIIGLWREQALSFPSGHATLAFASAICLSLLLPRLGWLFFLIATATAAERVIENAHYLSDVIAGAGLGVAVGWLVTRTILSEKNATLTAN